MRSAADRLGCLSRRGQGWPGWRIRILLSSVWDWRLRWRPGLRIAPVRPAACKAWRPRPAVAS